MDLLYKRKKSILKKKDGVLTNGGFKKKTKTFSGLSESLTRFTKRWGLERTVDLILYRNRINCEEKREGLEPMVDLILLRN